MKKTLLLLTLLFTLTACHKEPDMSDLDGRYFTYTNHDSATDFSAYGTYFIADSILVIGTGNDPAYAKGRAARELISEFAAQMNSCGYRRVHDIGKADLGIQMSYIEHTLHFLDYAGPIWWWGYPEYWMPSFWGDWGYWGYAYPVTFTYSAHSLLAEMVDLTAPQGRDEQLPVLWDCFIHGSREGYASGLWAMTDGIRQAFGQSPYLANENVQPNTQKL